MEDPMKFNNRGLVGALILAVALAGCREKAAVDAGTEGEGHKNEGAAASTVTLTPEAVAAAGLKVEPAAFRSIARRIPATGEVEFNGRRLAHLTARTAGRVEKVMAVKGDRVREGQVLAELYSPDYLALQAEFGQAAERARRLSGKAEDGASAAAVLEGVKRRFLVLGLTPAEIEELQASPGLRPLLPVRAALAGTVIESPVVAGDHVDLGDSLFRLADLTTVWASVRVFEKDLAAVKAGGEAVLRTQAYPGQDFRGRVLLVGDVVDPANRTVEVRVETPNPGSRLKAGMYIVASLAAEGERRVLVVPESSLQEISGQAVVFVETAPGAFVRRAVETGERWPGYVEILKGVAENEAVAAAGSFLLKSELLKASLGDDHGHD
jgi:Cu(I)/Ag(I) efflux system membrane fusion protein